MLVADSDACLLDRAKALEQTTTTTAAAAQQTSKVRTALPARTQTKQSEPDRPRILINPQLGPREALSLAYTSPVLLDPRPSLFSKYFALADQLLLSPRVLVSLPAADRRQQVHNHRTRNIHTTSYCLASKRC